MKHNAKVSTDKTSLNIAVDLNDLIDQGMDIYLRDAKYKYTTTELYTTSVVAAVVGFLAGFIPVLLWI